MITLITGRVIQKYFYFQHGSHGFESQCDVCTARISLDDFLLHIHGAQTTMCDVFIKQTGL